MKTNTQKIHADVTNADHEQPTHSHPRRTAALPSAAQVLPYPGLYLQEGYQHPAIADPGWAPAPGVRRLEDLPPHLLAMAGLQRAP